MGVGALLNQDNTFSRKNEFKKKVVLEKGYKTGSQKLSADGTIDIDVPVVLLEATKTGMAVTLPDGVEGSRLTLVQISEDAVTDTVVVTPANLANVSDAAVTTITFGYVGATCELIFVEGEWYVTSNLGATIA